MTSTVRFIKTQKKSRQIALGLALVIAIFFVLFGWLRIHTADASSTVTTEQTKNKKNNIRSSRSSHGALADGEIKRILIEHNNNWQDVIKEAKDKYQGDNLHIFLNQLADYAGEKNPEELILFLDSLDLQISGQLRGDIYKTALCRLAENHPNDAIKLADRLGIGYLKSAALASIVSQWANKDLISAVKAASNFDYADEREQAGQLLGFSIKDNTTAAISLIQDKEVSDEIRKSIAKFIGRFWDQSAKELVLKLRKSDKAEISYALTQFASRAPIDVADVLKNDPQLATNEVKNSLYNSIVSNDPEKNLNLLVNQNDQDYLVRGAFKKWLNQNSIEASTWINSSLTTIKSNELKDQLIGDMVLYLSRSGDNTSAAKWLDNIADEKTKQEIRNSIIKK